MHENVSYFPTLTATEPEEISWETVTTTIRGEFLREKTEPMSATRRSSLPTLPRR